MSLPTIVHVVGARPNFMKIAPLLRELEERGRSRNLLVHTGQHYDPEMSDEFFTELGIRKPDYNLGVGSGSHGKQTAAVLKRIEELLEDVSPDLLVVVGDVNSTLAASLGAVKLNVPVAHVEAGLRSGDLGMPEEINRILTDRISLFLLTPSADADENLRSEGLPETRIHRVGNIMIDSLLRHVDLAEGLDPLAQLGLAKGAYALATLHRPGNVDDPEQLREIASAFRGIAAELPLILPLHPRTAERVERFGVDLGQTRVLEPVGYLTMLALQKAAAIVITDSGGIQEETTVLGVPCLTLRPNTERPITISRGTNRLVSERSREKILGAFYETLQNPPATTRPELWDGQTAARIADIFEGWWSAGAPGFSSEEARSLPALA